ncbi:MAG TPA: threonylcarbamoyl-AMP synthase [Dehalococcoidia bacterium]|nr:threonylcarbamoyl-AMP synthase [Dehalococcoidia bacterium]
MASKLLLSIQQQVERGVSVLKDGGIVAFPTDTVYGLGAGIGIARAVERIYQVKKRPRTMPLPLLLSDISQIDQVAGSVPKAAWLLADRFLPGALTLVLARSPSLPETITGGGKTVAVRIPAHPIPIALARGLGTPIVGTSANLSGQPSALTADQVSAQLGDKVELIIDGGRCPGRESTIVDLSGETPVILREGAIPGEELQKLCPDLILK